MLLRPDLMVGVTGDNPHEVIADVVTHRDDSVANLLAHLATLTSAGFVVATLGPVRLWSVDAGKVDDRTSVQRAWSGDPGAYDVFRTSWDQWPLGTEVTFLLSSSMQGLTPFAPVASVGGFTLTADTQDDGFRFQPWVTAVAVSHQVHVVPGQDPTRGALGLLIPQTGVGLLFPHDRPWEAQRVEASTTRALITAAAEKFGDVLIGSSPPPGFPFATA